MEKLRRKNMYCPQCNCEVEGIRETITETYPVKGENVTIEARVKKCPNCGETLWDDELDNENLVEAFNIYRERHNLLQPADIRSIRDKYGLSQTAFARVLGFGDKTITRYENGSIADAAQNNLLELMKVPQNFEYLLEKNRANITQADYRTAKDKLREYTPKVIYNRHIMNATYRYTNHGNNTIHWGDWGIKNYA